MSGNKFNDRYKTAKDEERAHVPFTNWKTLWFNSGTLCNLECQNCYIESSPKNDRLVYISKDDVTPYLDEIEENKWTVDRIAFTGGEPFLNPHMFDILEEILSRGHQVLVLTNAYKVILRSKEKFLKLNEKYKDLFQLRVSMDHYTPEIHNLERGPKTLEGTIESFKWLHENGFDLSIAGRSLSNETNNDAINGYQNLLHVNAIPLELTQEKLVVFPEMQAKEDVPEITVNCWGILNKNPESIMCSTERMIVKRKGEDFCRVQACTLLAYSDEFTMGKTLKESMQKVYLNHSWCATFCVLGGASCSSTN